jgi:hypothetical protein
MDMVLFILSYLTVGFIAFRVLYARWRGRELVTLDLARDELHLARAVEKENPYPSGGSGSAKYADYCNARSRVEVAERRFSAARDEVRENSELPMSIFAGALWPITLVVIIAILFGKLVKVTLFRSGLDKAARRRADRITTQHRRLLEQERRQAELIALGKKALEEGTAE